ncbi:hypothetical protein JCM7686_2752 [Paracoccus aminophilus JCM 7686]|uniref:Uncharacterized protein n=1 Tax=Paracoccus aminophilus JCM 7686 TaxID=1367847 RepID=S5YE93_PARAH|nr:hypothetical protein JCM7686_2752 [Paracoccus aminophilus JCM 7686]
MALGAAKNARLFRGPLLARHRVFPGVPGEAPRQDGRKHVTLRRFSRPSTASVMDRGGRLI